MKFTPDEMLYLENDPTYKKYSKQALSAVTVATLVTDIKALHGTVDNLILFKYLHHLLEIVNRTASGFDQVREEYSLSMTYLAQRPAVGSVITDETEWSFLRPRIVAKDITLAGGAAANQVILAAVAGYYGVFKWMGAASDTQFTPTFAFQDQDDTALTGAAFAMNVGEIAAGKVVTLGTPVFVYSTTDNKALEVDVAGGAGVEKICIWGFGHYET